MNPGGDITKGGDGPSQIDKELEEERVSILNEIEEREARELTLGSLSVDDEKTDFSLVSETVAPKQ